MEYNTMASYVLSVMCLFITKCVISKTKTEYLSMALLKARLYFFVYVQGCPSTHQVQWLFKLTVLHLVRLYHINFGVMYMFLHKCMSCFVH